MVVPYYKDYSRDLCHRLGQNDRVLVHDLDLDRGPVHARARVLSLVPALAVALEASARAGRRRLARMPPHCRSVCCLAGQPFSSRGYATLLKMGNSS
mgnify:CR=1 FL=1